MSIVLELKEQLARRRQRKTELTLSADASIKAAKEILAAAGLGITPIAELDLATAQAHLNHAIKDQAELVEILAEIRRIDKELGQ